MASAVVGIAHNRSVVSEYVGTISELWRYPVKSLLGEQCEELPLEARGVMGDRAFAVKDAAGKLGSGKNTRRFRKMEGLFRLQAHYCDRVPYIRFPSGRILAGDDPMIHEALSAALGQSVVLAREAAVSHLDAGPIHLIASASLAWMRSALPVAHIDARRFWPNFVIESAGVGPVEQAWLGKRLYIGKGVELLVTGATERCGMVAFAQSELPTAPSVLRHITREANLRFGIYADVVVPGFVRPGDGVALEDDGNVG